MLVRNIFNTNSDIDVTNIMYDSRKDCPNSIFFAMQGKINDGHDFIDMAIQNGAICIVHSKEINNIKEKVVYIKVDNPTDAYTKFCSAFFGNPCEKMNVVGVTGTNGKTTIAWITRELISKFNKCGYIGTMGYYCGEKIEASKGNLTSPKSDEFFRICKEFVDYGCKSLILEASSEGLSTNRLDYVPFSIGVFNNLSSEHMDVHENMENYFKAKCVLFDKVKDNGGKALINIDDPYGVKLLEYSKCHNITYAIDKEADYKAKDVKLFNDHSEFILVHKNIEYPVYTRMAAKFNIYNLLAVLGIMNESGYDLNKTIEYLKDVTLSFGRCQIINEGQNFNVIVDYAFTPNSFEKIFDYAESITDKQHKIIAVFGAAGDRDHNRRPGTVNVADRRATNVILSYDDPSTEDMMSILIEMKGLFKNIQPEIILDRYEAIKRAVMLANEKDTILLLGKGDDLFFLCENGRVPWMSDEVAARKAIKEKLNIK